MEGLTEGRIVHFVLDQGSNLGQHRPAIVVRVWRVAGGKAQENGLCQLQVFTDDANDMLPAVLWKTSVEFDASGKPGTWHWIERE
jgi:hypothetical protein